MSRHIFMSRQSWPIWCHDKEFFVHDIAGSWEEVPMSRSRRAGQQRSGAHVTRPGHASDKA